MRSTPDPTDLPAALARYDTTLRPFVDTIQAAVKPRLLRLGMPTSRLGVKALLAVAALAAPLRVPQLVGRLAGEDRGGACQLPDHPETALVGERTRAG